MAKKWRFTVGVKLFLAFGAILALMGVMVILGVGGLTSTVDTYETEVLRIRENRLRAEIILGSGAEQGRAVYAHMADPSPLHRGEFLEQRDRALEALELLRGSAGTDHARMLMANIGDALDRLAAVAEDIFDPAAPGAAVTPGIAVDVGAVNLAELRAAQDGLREATQELIDFQDERSLMHRENVAAANERARLRIIITAFVMGALALIIVVTLTRGIAGPVRRVAGASRRLAEGDLTEARLVVASRDEIGDMAGAFYRMAAHFRTSVEQIRETSATLAESGDVLLRVADESAQAMGQIAAAVQQVAEGTNAQVEHVQGTRSAMAELRQAIDQIAVGAQRQAEQVAETTRTLDGMVRAVERIADSADRVADAAGQARDRARIGGEAVERVGGGMEDIRSAVGDVARNIDELGEYSRQIGQIVEIIDDIAGQTNLLALNAAIEAARAGEYGRGFGVVAEEVRQLAERSAASTREIGDIIGNIQVTVEAAIEAMDAGTGHVQTGTELADNARNALDEILRAIAGADELADEISVAAREMAQTGPVMLNAMTEMATVTEENTAATEQMAASSDEVMRAMDEVAAYAEETAAATEQVSASSEEVTASAEDMRASVQRLNDVSGDLDKLVGRFKV